MMGIAKVFERKNKESSSYNSTDEEASLKKPWEQNPNDSMGLETFDFFYKD